MPFVDYLWSFNLLFFITNLWVFVWAIRKFFVRPESGELPISMRRLQVLGTVMTVFYIAAFFFHPGATYEWQISATALLVISVLTFGWAITSSRDSRLPIAYADLQPAGICTSGPYRFVRHPFYFAYTLTWLGGSLMTQQVLFFLPTIVMLFVYWKLASREEASLLSGPHGSSYAAYQRNTWKLFPRFF